MAKPKPKSKPATAKSAVVKPSSLRLTAAWAAAIYAVLTLAFFHQVMLGGMTFVSPDAIAPAGFVRMGEQALYGERVYPLWNPFVFLGMPSFASGAYNPLIYPPDWPLALIHRVVPMPEMTWLVLYYFLGALFCFLLAREWGANPAGALLGGAAFVFAPNLVAVGSHGHGSQLVNSAYLPLLLWLTARWMRRGGIHHLGWLALAGGFQMLRGHVQITFYSWLAIALFLLVDVLMRDPDRPRGVRLTRAAGIGGAMVLAFGLAAVYNLPLRDYARHSIRGGGEGGGVGMDYATAWSMGPRELFTAVIPGAVGFGGATYWGTMPFTDYPNAFVGMVTVVLALAGLVTRGTPQAFAWALAGMSLLVALGKHFPLYGFLYDHLPLFNKFRVPVMVILLFQLSLALGLAWGWTRFVDQASVPETRNSTVRLLLGAAIALAALLVVGVLGQGAWRESYVAAALANRPQIGREGAELAFQGAVGDLARACVLGLAAIGLAFAVRRRWLPARPATAAALVLVLIELWPVSARVMEPTIGPPMTRPLEVGRDEVVEFLEKAGPKGSFRVLALSPQEFQSNRFAGFGISTVGGYHAAKPKLFQDLMESGYLQSPEWLRLLNVRYILTQSSMEGSGLIEAFRAPGTWVYEFPLALPRVTVVGEYRVAQPARAILDSVAAGRHDSARLTWLETDPGLKLGPVEGARAEITRYDLNRVSIQVETPGPALVRIADLWYPDWTATVDGREGPVLKADDLRRAGPVPAGRHTVELRFRSKSVRLGLIVSLASLIASLVLVFLGARRPPVPARSGEVSWTSS